MPQGRKGTTCKYKVIHSGRANRLRTVAIYDLSVSRLPLQTETCQENQSFEGPPKGGVCAFAFFGNTPLGNRSPSSVQKQSGCARGKPTGPRNFEKQLIGRRDFGQLPDLQACNGRGPNLKFLVVDSKLELLALSRGRHLSSPPQT